MQKTIFFILCVALCACQKAPENSLPEDTNWAYYLGGPDANHYSPLTQINRDNVKQLKQAWVYESGPIDSLGRTQIQCNPLIIDGVLYGSSPQLKFFALDAKTGKELWTFDPFSQEPYQQFGMGVNRGLCYWSDGVEKRILVTAKEYLYAIDANTGQSIPSFGKNGRVSLHEGLGENFDDYFIVANTPGIIYKDKIIQGARVSEATKAAPGHIRAFNVKTGELEWTFHTIPQPGELGYDTWPAEAWKTMGGANSWSGFSLDIERGMVFVPTGSASYDFYGGDRPGANLFANSVIALNANTGERIWHFQTVHHDMWDRDLPAPPNLVTVNHNGKKIDAVAQITKSAYVFLFDRETGEPLFPIEEVPVPPSKLNGEQAWPTQPIPTKPPPFARNRMQIEDVTTRTAEANTYVKTLLQQSVEGNPFIPPTLEGTIILPGFDGGGEWGGAAFDNAKGTMYVNASEMPWILQMIPHQTYEGNSMVEKGQSLYNIYCLACHGPEREGGNVYATVPSLIGLKDRLQEPAVLDIIANGKGVMPSFGHVAAADKEALVAFLLEKENTPAYRGGNAGREDWPYPYFMNGYTRFKDQDGYPAIQPPWGTLNAINLNTGEIAWKVTLGSHAELEATGMPPTGTENYGGPALTAGGLIFIAATMDHKIRAFDQDNGDLLWEADLPAAGFATPAVYAVGGKQYVVIACGGGKLGLPSGNSYVAFALED
ncbi:MAG: PQQ-binding-like beta-propeller repeat protein [Saprospiraceae bacterium]